VINEDFKNHILEKNGEMIHASITEF
jgi:hypothetical protein